MRYVNKVEITRIDDGTVLCMPFDGVCDSDFYTVVDKELVAQKIGQSIVDDGTSIENDYQVVYEMIDEFVTNDLVNDIFKFVEEYVHNNG